MTNKQTSKLGHTCPTTCTADQSQSQNLNPGSLAVDAPVFTPVQPTVSHLQWCSHLQWVKQTTEADFVLSLQNELKLRFHAPSLDCNIGNKIWGSSSWSGGEDPMSSHTHKAFLVARNHTLYKSADVPFYFTSFSGVSLMHMFPLIQSQAQNAYHVTGSMESTEDSQMIHPLGLSKRSWGIRWIHHHALHSTVSAMVRNCGGGTGGIWVIQWRALSSGETVT